MKPGTGPETDRTLQSAAGFYMIAESTKRKYKDVARMMSPIQKPTTDSCLNFWYHMSGNDVGSLSVYLKRSGSLGIAKWTESGNEGTMWRVAAVAVRSRQDFQVSF